MPDASFVASRQELRVSFHKTSGRGAAAVRHVFDCGGEACGPGLGRRAERTVTLSHMGFRHTLEIQEVLSVQFGGTVSFPAVTPYPVSRGAAAPQAWPWRQTADRPKCPLRGVRVCLVRWPTHEELACDVTAADGSYSFAAPVGLHVYATLRLRAHTAFVRSNTPREDRGQGRLALISRPPARGTLLLDVTGGPPGGRACAERPSTAAVRHKPTAGLRGPASRRFRLATNTWHDFLGRAYENQNFDLPIMKLPISCLQC